MVLFPVCLKALGRAVDCSWACRAWMKVDCLAYCWVCCVHLVGVTAAEMDVEVVPGEEALGISVGVMAVGWSSRSRGSLLYDGECCGEMK
eukprot:scaffold75200_cov76-Cyclotella_meneghiniana.AAC.2